MTPLQPRDYEMIRHAIGRGQVIVERGETRAQATLISWRPHHHGRRTKYARVQFASGRFLSVPIATVTTIETET